MSLSDGDPAGGGDIWFRIATQQGHLVRGRVHHSAFGGNAIARPTGGKNRPWDRELSGRLRTLAGTLEEITHHAEAYCEAETAKGGGTKTFSGVMYVRVRDAKKSFENILTTAIHYTPLDKDKAHADLTFNAVGLVTRKNGNALTCGSPICSTRSTIPASSNTFLRHPL
jgi:hypothetical protein